MSIEFKENAVCYASDRLWFEAENHNDCLADCDGVVVKTKYIVNCHDFQLNEPKQGDYLPKSELDTEQKYNDAVEVFGLFGFEPLFSNYHDCSPANTLYFINEYRIFIGGCHSNVNPKRELTYNQLMAIGKLKRLMNRRASGEVSKVNLDIERAVKSTINAELDKPVDNVKSPSHYQLIEGVESIEIIARSMTQEQWKGFCLGNILKYRIRAGKKDALQQDIDKANFYGDLYEMHKEKCYG